MVDLLVSACKDETTKEIMPTFCHLLNYRVR